MEKPLTMNAKRKITEWKIYVSFFCENSNSHLYLTIPIETEAIIKFAREKGLLLLEALWSRFLPSSRFIVDQLEKGIIGEVYSVDASLGIRSLDEVNRINQKRLGGGTILDLGIYTINIIQQAFNNEQPEKVVAVGHVNPDGVDLSVSAALAYSNGRSATLRTHSIVQLPNEAIIVGTKGYIKVR